MPFVHFNRDRALPDGSPQFFYLLNGNGDIIHQHPIRPNSHTYNSSMVQLTNGNYLMASGRGHLIEFNRKEKVKDYPHMDWDWGWIIGLLVDSKGGLWVSTTKGIRYFKSGSITQNGGQMILPGKFSLAVVEDFQGGIWVQLEGQTINRIAFPNYLLYRKENGMLPTNHLSSIGIKGSAILTGGNQKRIHSIQPETNTIDSIKAPSTNRHITNIFYDSLYDRTWLGYRGAFYFSDKHQWIKYQNNKLPKNLGKVTFYSNPYGTNKDSVSKIVTTGNRVFFMKDTSITFLSEKYPFTPSKAYLINDSLWILTSGGVYLQTDKKLIAMQQHAKEFGYFFLHMAYLNQQLWFSSITKGLFVFNGNEIKPIKHKGQTITHTYLTPVSDQEIWYISSNKIYAFANDTTPNHFTGTHFSTYPARPRFSLQSQVVHKQQSIFWLLVEEGILKTDIEDLRNETFKKPHLTIQGISINDVPTPKLNSHFDLHHTENHLKIDYLGINYSDQEVLYRYRINGEEWKTTEETSLQFLKLPPGTYHFEIQAQLSTNPWTESQFLTFNIAPPFWLTWWFISASILVTIALLYWAIAYRFRVIHQKKKLIIDRLTADQKAQRARMDPHFVFNVLTSLQYLIHNDQKEQATHFLKKLSSLMRNTLGQTDTDYISIANEIEFLKEFIELEQIRLEGKFEYTIQVDSTVDLKQTIPNFLIQPIVENAIHHGLKSKPGKGMLQLFFQLRNKQLVVTVEDNGIGIDQPGKNSRRQQKNRRSYGIQIIKDRLLLHNQTDDEQKVIRIKNLNTTQSHQTGTRVQLIVKL